MRNNPLYIIPVFILGNYIFGADSQPLISYSAVFPKTPSFVSAALGEKQPDSSFGIKSPWVPGSIFTLMLIDANVLPDGASKPAGREELKKPTPAFINGKRLYFGGANNRLCGFGGGDGFMNKVVFSVGSTSPWRSFERDLWPFCDDNWSWDGSTCMAAFSSQRVYRSDGSCAWECPEYLIDVLKRGSGKQWFRPNSWPNNETWAQYAPGAINNQSVGFLILANQENIDGSIKDDLAWSVVSSGREIKRSFTDVGDQNMTVNDVVNDIYAFNQSSWAWNLSGGMSAIIKRNTNPALKVSTIAILRSLLVIDEKWTWREEILEQALHAAVIRYDAGFLLNQVIQGDGRHKNQVVGIVNKDKYPFRYSSSQYSRIEYLDDKGRSVNSWVLPGGWSISKIRMRGDYVLLQSMDENRDAAPVVYCLFDPKSGAVANKAIIKGRDSVFDAVWNNDKVAFFYPLRQYMRNSWVGDTEIIGDGL